MLELIRGSLFGRFQALKKISLDVEEGEFRGLIGPNGSGKTTIFNVISGVFQASAGQIKFLGQDITHFTPDRICHSGLTRSFQIPASFQGNDRGGKRDAGRPLRQKGKAVLSQERFPAEALRWLDFVGLKVDENTMPGDSPPATSGAWSWRGRWRPTPGSSWPMRS